MDALKSGRTEKREPEAQEASAGNGGGWVPDRLRGVLAAALLGLLLGLFCLHLALGSVYIPLRSVVRILTGQGGEQAAWETIILMFRLPRALTAVLAGAALAASGLQMQTLFRNPLADPYVLGINAGASLGVALVVLGSGVLGQSVALADLGATGEASIALGATVGAAVVFLLVVAVARKVQSNMTLLILGLMFGYVTSSAVTILLHFSAHEHLQAFVVWTFGSFSGVTWGQLRVMAPVVLAGLALCAMHVKPLNALLLGGAYARSMGLNVRRTRFWLIGSTSLLAGVVTAFCGPIGFLGIAVPHLCRGLFGTSDHRVLVPVVAMAGALIALLSDLVAQLPGTSSVLPLNAVTSLLGAPVVIWIVLRQRGPRMSMER